MSSIKIFVEVEDGKTWEDICDEVASGITKRIVFKGTEFSRTNNWVSVYEEDPPEGELVLVAWTPIEGMPITRFKHFYGLATYEEGEYHWNSGKDYDRIKVLAWMELPDYYKDI